MNDRLAKIAKLPGLQRAIVIAHLIDDETADVRIAGTDAVVSSQRRRPLVVKPDGSAERLGNGATADDHVLLIARTRIALILTEAGRPMSIEEIRIANGTRAGTVVSEDMIRVALGSMVADGDVLPVPRDKYARAPRKSGAAAAGE
jgi:hypothetical protein